MRSPHSLGALALGASRNIVGPGGHRCSVRASTATRAASFVERVYMKRFFRVVSVLVLVGGMFGAAMAQDFNWKQFDGTNIRFLMNQHPFTEFIQPLLPEFEALTGIKMTFETLPEAQFRQKRLLEVTAGTSTLDGYM